MAGSIFAVDKQRVAFSVRGPIARSDLPGLCDRICALLGETGAAVALCDASGVPADAVTVEALARLQVAAHRHGCQVRLRHASPELLDLLAFMGLSDVVPESDESRVATRGAPTANQEGGTDDQRGRGG